MGPLFRSIRDTKLLWLLVLVPLPLLIEGIAPESYTLLFLISILAIIPLAALLSIATEAVAERTGDAVGGLMNATLGNLTELIIALTALRAGEYVLVKASIAGAIVTNTLFMMGASFLIGGLRHHIQEFSLPNARLQIGLLFLAAFGMTMPSAITAADAQTVTRQLSLGVSIILIGTYGLGLLFSLGTHREVFSGKAPPEALGPEAHGNGAQGHADAWPMPVALATLAGVTVMVALVSEVFVSSLTGASQALGLSPAFVGFIVVALVGAAAEMATAFSAAAKNRLDLSVGIAFGSAAQIALFVTPVLVLTSYFVGPAPMTLQFWDGAVVMIFVSVLTAALVTGGGRSAWFIGVLMLMVYAIFALTLFLLPPAAA
jgi:Ca2+:H+ antiporter